MSRKQKLELTWIGKDERSKLEPRILMEVPEKSYHAATRRTPDDQFDNLLIHGDNLLALKALEQEYAGKVKCIYIDPPYNTGSAFEHYDDGLEHSLWLSLIKERISILYRILAPNGSLWISIDDTECHYLKIICDEIFGRDSFLASFIWKKVDSPNDNKVPITPDHEYVICYGKNKKLTLGSFKQKSDQKLLNAYRPADEQSDRPYRDRLLKKNGKSSLRADRPSMFFPITGPDGIDVYPIHDDGREARWALSQKSVNELLEKNEIIWKQRQTSGGIKWVPYTREYAPTTPSKPYATIWSDLHTTRQTKLHQKDLFGENAVFETPKPENLIARILEISSNIGEIVLDSFLGSGTTAAVAHKMGRRWIGIELGEHCYTHCLPRLRKVVDGADPGGITDDVDWKGGGGFRFCELGPSLIRQDAWGNPIINAAFNPEMLAEALCKLEGFRYAPHPETFWMQGQSSESDFIYVTTQYVTAEMLAKLSAEVGNARTLLLCCSAHDEASAPNITLRKIPNAVLQKCEWGKDDYSLSISSLPAAPPEDDEAETAGVDATPARPARAPRGGRAASPRDDKARLQPSLFDLAPGDDA